MEINSDYDILSALRQGYTPDKTGHWPSRIGEGEKEGLILKSLEHPTILNTLVNEMNQGYVYWYKDPEERKMYTYNKIQDLFNRMYKNR